MHFGCVAYQAFSTLVTGGESHKAITSDVSRILSYYYTDPVCPPRPLSFTLHSRLVCHRPLCLSSASETNFSSSRFTSSRSGRRLFPLAVSSSLWLRWFPSHGPLSSLPPPGYKSWPISRAPYASQRTSSTSFSYGRPAKSSSELTWQPGVKSAVNVR